MLLEKQRANTPLVKPTSPLAQPPSSSPVNVVPSDEADVIAETDILPWELEHAEQELYMLLRPVPSRLDDADYVHRTPKNCSGKAKPVPAYHNDAMLQLMIQLGGKHNYDVQAMFQEYDFIYRTKAASDRCTDLRFTTKPLVRQWVTAFSKKTEQAAAFDRHNPAADLLLNNAQPSILVPSVLMQTAPPDVTLPTQVPQNLTPSQPNIATDFTREKPPNIWWLQAKSGADLVQAGERKNTCPECNKHYLNKATHPTGAFPGNAS